MRSCLGVRAPRWHCVWVIDELDEAADVIWATASAELFVLFTQQRRWTPRAYERWLADTWSRLLLAEGEGTDRARPTRRR